MSHYEKIWGFKADGSARLFELAVGERLPTAWSPDINVILNSEHRTGEHISKAGGESTRNPVRLSGRAEEKVEEPEDPSPLQYDENNRQVLPMKRSVGRPPKGL